MTAEQFNKLLYQNLHNWFDWQDKQKFPGFYWLKIAKGLNIGKIVVIKYTDSYYYECNPGIYIQEEIFEQIDFTQDFTRQDFLDLTRE